MPIFPDKELQQEEGAVAGPDRGVAGRFFGNDPGVDRVRAGGEAGGRPGPGSGDAADLGVHRADRDRADDVHLHAAEPALVPRAARGRPEHEHQLGHGPRRRPQDVARRRAARLQDDPPAEKSGPRQQEGGPVQGHLQTPRRVRHQTHAH